jgi:protein involved in polysaccharide export with SLBB domain
MPVLESGWEVELRDCCTCVSPILQRKHGADIMWRRLLVFSIISLSTAGPMVGKARAAEYGLGVQDHVHVKVLEWHAGKQEYYEWAALTGEYVVNDEGLLSLPLLGQLDVSGKTTKEVASLLADELQKKTGSGSRPYASVEVSQYRPFYILGDVGKPGEYAFRPDLTVDKAVSLASGLYRPGDLAMVIGVRRDEINANGIVESAQTDLKRSLIRRARLQAEMNGLDAIHLESQTGADPEFISMVKDEDSILRARNNALTSQRSSLKESRELYLKQVDALEKKKVSQTDQIALARQERDAIATLQKKGLTVNTRVTQTERTVSELEGRLLDFETAAIEARQNVNKTVRDELNIDADRQARIISELQDTNSHIDDISAKLKTAENLIEMTSSVDTASIASTKVSDGGGQDAGRTFYTITRRGRDNIPYEISADENTDLKPGDVVHVRSVGGNGQKGAERLNSSAAVQDLRTLRLPISAVGPEISARGPGADSGN